MMADGESGAAPPRDRDWWSDSSGPGLPSSAPPPPPTSPTSSFRAHPADLHPRRRGLLDAHLENVMLPPRPSDLSDENLSSFLEDEAFADDDHKTRRLTLSMVFPGLRLTRRSLPTCLLIAGLVLLAFLAGFALNLRSGGGASDASVLTGDRNAGDAGSEAAGGRTNEAAHDDRPQCGSQYAIQGGTAYGGHNEGFGCVNTG